METLRILQALFTAYIGLFAASVVLNNITDYGTNHNFVRHVMSMDTIFPDCRLTNRRITSPLLHHAAYVFIIVLEAAVALGEIGPRAGSALPMLEMLAEEDPAKPVRGAAAEAVRRIRPPR